MGGVVALLDHPDPATRAELVGILEPVGVVVRDCASVPAGAGVVALIVGPDIRVDAAELALLPDLRIVAASCTGVDHVDVSAAAARGVWVTNVADYCTEEVAEHALTLILDLLRGVTRSDRRVRRGGWDCAADTGGPVCEPARIAGTVLGLVGFGRIAQALAGRARALGMAVRAYDPGRAEQEFGRAGVSRCVELSDLLAGADVISLHVPLTARTRHLIDATALTVMRPGSLLVNVARGGLVDEAALLDALRTGHLAGAGLDVLEREPPPTDDPLLTLDSVVCTPHSAWQSPAARRLVFTLAAASVAAVLRGHEPAGVVAHPAAAEGEPSRA